MLYFNLISLSLIVVGAAVLSSQAMDIVVSARVYPLVLVGLVSSCAVVIAVREVAARAVTPPLDAKLQRILSAPTSARLRGGIFVVTWLVYTWALPFVGFIVATTCALAASFGLLGVRRHVVGLLGALTFSVVFSILFATVLYIPMPEGAVDRALIETIYALQH